MFNFLWLLISHNVYIFIVQRVLDVYRIKDFLSSKLFVLRGKGNLGNYHIEKLKKSNTFFDDIKLFVLVGEIAKLLNYNKKEIEDAQLWFHSIQLSKYSFEREILEWIQRLGSIKTGGDFFNAFSAHADLLGYTPNGIGTLFLLRHRLGSELFQEMSHVSVNKASDLFMEQKKIN